MNLILITLICLLSISLISYALFQRKEKSLAKVQEEQEIKLKQIQLYNQIKSFLDSKKNMIVLKHPYFKDMYKVVFYLENNQSIYFWDSITKPLKFYRYVGLFEKEISLHKETSPELEMLVKNFCRQYQRIEVAPPRGEESLMKEISL